MSARLALLAAAALSAAPAPPPAEAFPLRAAARAPAPRIEITDLAGAPAVLAARPGQVLLVVFWATWCDTCRAELPGLLALGRALETRHPGRFRMVGVSMDEERAAVERYLRALPGRGSPGWSALLDAPDQRALGAYYTAARGPLPDEYQLPQTYVVDDAGALIGWLEGPGGWGSPAAREYLEALLRAAPRRGG